ncbi:MAG: acetyl-CoA carboxylase biotin carboxylase subunit [Sphingomonadaceae bacterium]
MFDKILIANRGEIACRVIRTCRRLGIATVAVHSDADAAALHVEMADEAVHLGPPPAAQSYLLGEKIIEAARATGAQAIHPGYGFLSERDWFVKAVEEAGLVFIGPPSAAIAAMGDKIESKKLAVAAGVNVVPGHVGEIADGDEAARIAADIGYPVMMKASAGGGGKGMRLAYSEAELREGFDGVRREAKASFGDDRVFIEKFIEQPRHIEIQVLGDRHGNIVHLFERDCSIQRRHQKVVEEAPSPFVTPEMRAAMGAQAVELARKVGYHSAGTVEFIAGADRGFYFLEMNTRLQVEHPVTECITGLDLVEQMIRVAAGERLAFGQDDLAIRGHAIETRFYAEDPYRGFLPSIGRLTHYQEPPAMPGIRVDSGVVEGSEISMFYDPMIAKLITHGETRDEAAERQLAALDRYLVRGISHNADFLSAVMRHPRFRAGTNVTTGFIAEEFPDGFAGAPLDPAGLPRLLALAAVVGKAIAHRAAAVDGRLNGESAAADWVVELDGEQHPVTLTPQDGGWVVRVAGSVHRVETAGRVPPSGVVEALVDGEPTAAQLDRNGAGFRLTRQGRQHRVRFLTPRAAELARHMLPKAAVDTSRYLLCPMPGLVVALHVAEGDSVQPGQPLAVVEAMKMENVLRAERAARVAKLHARPGDSLAVDAIILEFDAAS